MGFEAYEAAHLNPWPRLRQEFARRGETSQPAKTVRPHHLRCIDALLESTQDPRARECSGVDDVGIAWIVDPVDARGTTVQRESLGTHLDATLAAAAGWLPQTLLDGSTSDVMVRDGKDRRAPPQWLANGEIVFGKPGSEILVGNTLKGECLRFAAAAVPYICSDTPHSRRSRWRLVAGGVVALTVTILALWSGLYSVVADDNALSRIVIGLVGTSLFVVALQIDRWWVKELLVVLWTRRVRRPQPAHARDRECASVDATPAPETPTGETATPVAATIPTRARGWRRLLQWLAYPLVCLYGWFLLTWGNHGQAAAGLVFLFALLVHLALLPFWLLFCRQTMRWRWWITSGAAAFSILSILINQALN